jgi:uncharacterized protein HemX
MLMLHAARFAAAVAIIGVTLGVAGCAGRVKQSDFNNEVAKLRQEMQAGDQKAAGRVDSLNKVVADQQRRLDALDQELKSFKSE